MNRIVYFSPSPILHADTVLWQRYLIHPLKCIFGDGSKDWIIFKENFEFYNDIFKYNDEFIDIDYIFLPFTINYYIKYNKLYLVEEQYNLSISLGIKLVIWIDGDYDLKRHFIEAIYIKNASYKSLGINNEIIRPGDVPTDLLSEYCGGELVLRTKSNNPSIGFTGLAKSSLPRLFYLVLRNVGDNILSFLELRKFEAPSILPWFLFRNKVINILTKSSLICNFNLRTRFAVGVKNGDQNHRLEFIQNILNSDYTLCIRGASNYSIRFYESLCLGRIPILIDTDCKLPLEHIIDWDSVILRINAKDILFIEKQIKEFHDNISSNDFMDRQLKCREIWLKYLSNASFSHFILN